MKMLAGGLVAFGLVTSAFATSPVRALPSNEKAVVAFIELQSNGKNADLNKQIAHLKKNGHTKMGKTQVVLLAGGCGFAGCDYTYLATTPYETLGANTRTAVVSAVIRVGATTKGGDVKKVLSEKEIENLIRN